MCIRDSASALGESGFNLKCERVGTVGTRVGYPSALFILIGHCPCSKYHKTLVVLRPKTRVSRNGNGNTWGLVAIRSDIQAEYINQTMFAGKHNR